VTDLPREDDLCNIHSNITFVLLLSFYGKMMGIDVKTTNPLFLGELSLSCGTLGKSICRYAYKNSRTA
jgi:hypothetical protein